MLKLDNNYTTPLQMTSQQQIQQLSLATQALQSCAAQFDTLSSSLTAHLHTLPDLLTYLHHTKHALTLPHTLVDSYVTRLRAENAVEYESLVSAYEGLIRGVEEAKSDEELQWKRADEQSKAQDEKYYQLLQQKDGFELETEDLQQQIQTIDSKINEMNHEQTESIIAAKQQQYAEKENELLTIGNVYEELSNQIQAKQQQIHDLKSHLEKSQSKKRKSLTKRTSLGGGKRVKQMHVTNVEQVTKDLNLAKTQYEQLLSASSPALAASTKSAYVNHLSSLLRLFYPIAGKATTLNTLLTELLNSSVDLSSVDSSAVEELLKVGVVTQDGQTVQLKG